MAVASGALQGLMAQPTFKVAMSREAASPNSKASVIILTGFLGSGKTTLLNRILTAEHGRRVAVIVNEFGEVGIDHHLLLSSNQEVVQNEQWLRLLHRPRRSGAQLLPAHGTPREVRHRGHRDHRS